MSLDRYLATSYPLFHRTSVTNGRLLTLLAILITIELTLTAVSVNDIIISLQVHILIVFILVTPPILFINYKLFLVIRRGLGNNEISSKRSKIISLTQISSCLIAVASYVVLSVPVVVYVGIMKNCMEGNKVDFS